MAVLTRAGAPQAPELQRWFDLSPVATVVYERSGRIVRANPAFHALAGGATAQLSPDLARLLDWDGGGQHAALRAGAQGAQERSGSLTRPDGRTVRLRARLVAYLGVAGDERAMAVLDDRSLEDERDLAQMEIGALMDTAGIGVATYEASRGWLQSRAAGSGAGAGGGLPAALQGIRRERVEASSLPAYDELQQALREGRRAQVRYSVQLPAHGRRWLLTRVEPGELADGRHALSVVTLDITEQEEERRRARDELQLQAERTRAILDSVLVGIVTVGTGGIEWMNRSARRMFGGELADFIGVPMSTVATDDPDHPLRATHYLRALADGQAETFECRLRARDGREFWVVGNAVVTGRDDGGAQITFALLDIERRRQAEISIAQAQASLQRIIETAPLAIALFDAASSRVLRLNHMAGLFFGVPMDTALGGLPADWLDTATATALVQDLAEAAQGAEVVRREWRRPGGRDGQPQTWDVRIIGLAAAGEPQVLLVASDVTEQRAAEQARFDAAVSQREMLVKEVHHRIKNNLQGVAGLLQQSAARRPEMAPLIDEIVSQVQAIAQVHGLQVGVSGPLRLKPVLEAITQSVSRTFGHGIELTVTGVAPHRFALPETESIPVALAVNELLTNAIKHGAGPGAPVRCALHCSEAQVEITITNVGRLREGFSLGAVPPGVSGLGLVRSLLPRRSAALTLGNEADGVVARLLLQPPGITVLEPL
ncbi:MAG: PAS domain-containing protein [Aquabacterium sp.]